MDWDGMAGLRLRAVRDLETNAAQAATLLAALANERRLAILCELVDGERSVGELVAAVGLTQSALSQHLAKLRAAGVVATRREAQTIFYRLASAAAGRILETLAAIYCRPSRKPLR
jgi:ArsR family transcriptional regulator, virulence genes transcriptional regulator